MLIWSYVPIGVKKLLKFSQPNDLSLASKVARDKSFGWENVFVWLLSLVSEIEDLARGYP